MPRSEKYDYSICPEIVWNIILIWFSSLFIFWVLCTLFLIYVIAEKAVRFVVLEKATNRCVSAVVDAKAKKR